MTGKYYYKKNKSEKLKKTFYTISILFSIIGFSCLLYVFLPIVSWHLYFHPAFANQQIISSVPVLETDYSKAENWFPNYDNSKESNDNPDILFYKLSIPDIDIDNAIVSTVDSDLSKHLINFHKANIPGEKGNTVILGHSSLPQLFSPTNYKTILANAYKLKKGDFIYALVDNVTYPYKIFETKVVDPSDTSILSQNYDDSLLTLITCTPPGTTWKRLVIKAKLEKI